MKKLLLGFPVFVVAFSIGYSVVPDFQKTIEDQTRSQMVERVTQLNANFAPVVPLPRNEDFVPEFRDLIDFEDVEVPKYSMKLVDVFHHSNEYRKSEVIARNGEQWLGLFIEDGNVYLRNIITKIKLDPSYEGYGDEDYVQLTTGRSTQPVFIVRNAKFLNLAQLSPIIYDHIGKRSGNATYQSNQCQSGTGKNSTLPTNTMY